jgi:hypothetical protein
LPTRHKLTVQQSPSPTNLIAHQKDPFKRTAVMHRKLSQPLSYRLIQDTSSQALNCHNDLLIPSLRLLYFTSILTKRVSSIMHEQLQRIVTENMSQIRHFFPFQNQFHGMKHSEKSHNHPKHHQLSSLNSMGFHSLSVLNTHLTFYEEK